MRSDPVGAAEIAARLTTLGSRTEVGTVRSWLHRRREWERAGKPTRRAGEEVIPEPRWTVNSGPSWDWWLDIAPWLVRTKRLPVDKQHLTPWAD